MTARHRARVKTVTTQRHVVPAGTILSTDIKLYEETCDDIVNDFGNEHILTIDKVVKTYDPIGGNSKNSSLDTTYVIYDGKCMYEYQHTNSAAHLTLSGLPSNNQVGIETVSRTNPSKPSVDLPLMLYELREIPQMLKYLSSFYKRLGKSIPIDAVIDSGNLVLLYQYGLRPLVSDLSRLFDFQSQVASVEKKIRGLNANGGIHSKVDMGNYSAYERTTPILESGGGILISGVVDRLTICSIWGTTRWTADLTQPYPRTDAEILNLARKVVLGLNPSADTVYNAIPWSWLLDWCSNTGDYISTFRNTIPAVHSKVCVMKHTKTVVTGQKTSANGFFMTGGKTFSTTHETKTRAVMPFLLPELSMPNLDARQLSILGSLAVQRIPRDTMRYVINT